MKDFKIELPKSLVAVSCEGARITEQQSRISESERQRQVAAQQSLKNMQVQLNAMQDRVEGEMRALRERVADLSSHVVKTLVQNDSTLKDAVVQRFADVLCSALEPSLPDRIHVHPDCLKAIRSWAEASSNALQIVPDAAIAPGDCIVECGDRGLAANLDSFLQSALAAENQEAQVAS